jgi:phosphoglycolate phosphatase
MPTAAHPKAILFDFDGTLADSFLAITESVNHVRSLHGLEPLTVEQVRPFVGWGPGTLLNETVPAGDPAANATAYREHHPSVLASGTRLLPGAHDLLSALHAAHCRTAVTSNKPRVFTAELLRLLGIDGLVTLVVGPEDVPRPKPAPDMLVAALERLEVRPADALYIGDMTIDITTAKEAGVPIWVVGTGVQGRATLEAAGPDGYFPDLAAIQDRMISMGLLPPR